MYIGDKRNLCPFFISLRATAASDVGHSQTNYFTPVFGQFVDLVCRCRYIPRIGDGHRLDANGCVTPDRDAADADWPRFAPRYHGRRLPPLRMRRISVKVTTIMSARSNMKPMVCVIPSIFGEMRLPRTISINTKRMRPPSRAGTGRRLKIARFRERKAANSQKGRKARLRHLSGKLGYRHRAGDRPPASPPIAMVAIPLTRRIMVSP